MHNSAFASRGLDWAYVALDVPEESLTEAVRGLAAAGFVGANVTAPHKVAAAALCDEADAESVNTLLFERGRIRGTSTDTEILRGLEPLRPAVVGAGGAGRAFIAALPGARVFARSGTWPPEVADADVVVHATSVRDEVMVEVAARQTLVDLVYPDSATADAARAAGATVLDGLDVLVSQGAASFELWTGVAAPLDVMRAAVRLR